MDKYKLTALIIQNKIKYCDISHLYKTLRLLVFKRNRFVLTCIFETSVSFAVLKTRFERNDVRNHSAVRVVSMKIILSSFIQQWHKVVYLRNEGIAMPLYFS